MVPGAYRDRIDGWQVRSPVVKRPAPAAQLPGRVGVPGPPGGDRRDPRPGRRPGGLRRRPAKAFAIGLAELYFQTAYDPSVAPAGRHLVSVFAQYAPYTLAEGTWDSRREEIGRLILDAIASFAPDLHDCVAEVEVLGPPDVERHIGLTGSHIFQGETMPDQMWKHRLRPRTPSPASTCAAPPTRPAGSVIALNGRNAAMAVLADTTALPGAGGEALDQEALGGEEQRMTIGTVRITEPAIRVVLATSIDPAGWDSPSDTVQFAVLDRDVARTGTRSRRS